MMSGHDEADALQPKPGAKTDLDLTKVDEADLLAETARRKQEKDVVEHHRRVSVAEVGRTYINELLVLTRHSRTSCSDEKPDNAFRRDDQPNCPRCFLLRVKKDKHWPEDVDVKLSFEKLPPVGGLGEVG